MTKHQVHTARLDRYEGNKLMRKVDISTEDVLDSDKKGLLVPIVHPYKKKTIEATIELCIEELNKIETTTEKRLFHIAKGLLSTLDFMTNPERCDSWKDHSFIEKDKESAKAKVARAFNFDETLRGLKSNPLRHQLVPIQFVVDSEDVLGLLEKETESRFHMAIAFPKSEDSRQRFVYSVRLLATLVSSLSPDKYRGDFDYMSGQTDEHIHEEWMALMKRVMNGLIYLVNISSWNKNELMSFDLMELTIKAKL